MLAAMTGTTLALDGLFHNAPRSGCGEEQASYLACAAASVRRGPVALLLCILSSERLFASLVEKHMISIDALRCVHQYVGTSVSRGPNIGAS